MDFPINSGYLDEFFDVTLDMENYFSLSLPVPQSASSRDDEIRYWKDYINGQYHDLNMVFGPEIDEESFYGYENHQLTLEFEMREKKYAAVRGILESLSKIKSFPPMGQDLANLNLAYKNWDELELKIIELLIEVCTMLPIGGLPPAVGLRAIIDNIPKKNPAQRHQSLDSDFGSLPNYCEDFSFLDMNPPQEYTTCSPVECTSEPRCRLMSTSSPSDYPTPNQTPDPSRRENDSPTPSSGSIDGKFVCSYATCGQRFPRQNALLRHIASIHDDTVSVACPYCPKGHRDGKPFNRSDNFQRHVTKQHPNISKDDISLKEALERLWKAGGVRTSWGKKGGVKKKTAKRRS